MTTTKMPEWLEPMAATLTQDRFTGAEWLFERKFDGIRLLAYKRGKDVRLTRATGCRRSCPRSREPSRSLPVDEVILDGEVDWDGRSGYHVFDILWLDGRAVTSLPLEERRALLKQIPFSAPMRRVELLHGDEPWERARREGWEGVIAKRRGSPYEHRRSKHWLKMKCEASQELVVGGFTDPQGARVGLGALLVGYYEGRRFRVCRQTGDRLRHEAAAGPAPAARRHRDSRVSIHEGERAAASARALGAADDRRAGGVHRVDRARQAAPSALDRRALRQDRARGGERTRRVIPGYLI